MSFGLLRKASIVLPARCGAIVTLSNRRNGWSGGSGSQSNTSNAAPMIRRSPALDQRAR